MSYQILVESSGRVLGEFLSKADANKWLIETYTETRQKSTHCSLPFVVRIEKKRDYDIVLYDTWGNERKRGSIYSIADFMGTDIDTVRVLISHKYVEMPKYMNWYVEIQRAGD